MMDENSQKQRNEANEKLKPHVKLLATWMRLLSETCQRSDNSEITEERIRAYALVLSDIPLDDLEMALRRCTQECKFFPTASEIREKSGHSPQLLAEAAWETLQKLVYHDWHPDIGWVADVKLEPAMEYAIRQVGGLHRIHDCPEDTFNFLRKDFLVAHSRYSAEDGDQVRLSHKQASEILGQLQRGVLPS